MIDEDEKTASRCIFIGWPFKFSGIVNYFGGKFRNDDVGICFSNTFFCSNLVIFLVLDDETIT